MVFNTLRPRQNGRLFPDDVFKCIFLNEKGWISIKISLKFVPKGPISNILALVQIMAWCRPGDKPLSEPMMVILPTHICVTQPQWVNNFISPIWCSHLKSWFFSSGLKGTISISIEASQISASIDNKYMQKYRLHNVGEIVTQIYVGKSGHHSWLVWIMVRCVFGVNPLSQPVLTYYFLYTKGEFLSKFKRLHWKKCISTGRIYIGHFVKMMC